MTEEHQKQPEKKKEQDSMGFDSFDFDAPKKTEKKPEEPKKSTSANKSRSGSTKKNFFGGLPK